MGIFYTTVHKVGRGLPTAAKVRLNTGRIIPQQKRTARRLIISRRKNPGLSAPAPEDVVGLLGTEGGARSEENAYAGNRDFLVRVATGVSWCISGRLTIHHRACHEKK